MRKTSSNLPDFPGRQDRFRKNAKTGSKSLDCFFVYNGHEFNAFEVLEVPAGAPKDFIEKAYREKLSEAHSSQKNFYRCAYEAAMIFTK